MAFDQAEYLQTKHPLRFDADGKFRILLLTDLHGGTDSHPQLKAGVDAIVKAAKPNLVLLGGDQSGCHIGCHTPEELHVYLVQMTEAMETAGTPWAHVYGNHDYNLGVSNERAQEVYEAFPHCVSKRGPRDIHGVGNYVLPILASKTDDVVFNVWGMDSHDDNKQFCRTYGLPTDTQIILPKHFAMGYRSDCPHTDQIWWYYETSRAIEHAYGRKIPGILYQHIPLPEFCLIPRNRKETRMTGVRHENVGCNELNSGLFSACLQRGDIRGIFCGHDHLNDFCGQYCGVYLGNCAGINYDCGSRDNLRGGRLIDIDERHPADITTKMLRLRSILGRSADNKGRPVNE